MPFNGSGGFTVYVPGNPVITGTVISSTAFNNTMGDFALGLSNCVTADGQTAIGVPIKFYAGTVTLPGIAFGAAPGSGMYYINSSNIGISVAGAQALNLSTANIGIGQPGSATNPSLIFIGDANTGFYHPGADVIGLTCGGSDVVRFSTTKIAPVLPIASSYGVGVSSPDYQFFNDDNTGFYQIGADNVGVACNGTNAMDITATGTGVGGQASSASTALATPASTTAISSMRLPHGAAPTNPGNGDMWTTTAGLFVRINGVTVGPLS